jgi:hypothetical protein
MTGGRGSLENETRLSTALAHLLEKMTEGRKD